MIDNSQVAQLETYFATFIANLRTVNTDVANIAQNAADIVTAQGVLATATQAVTDANTAITTAMTGVASQLSAGTITPDQLSAALAAALVPVVAAYDAAVTNRTTAQTALDTTNAATGTLATQLTNDQAARLATANAMQPYIVNSQT